MKEYIEATVPNYSYVFNFESNFKNYEAKSWMEDNWTLTFPCTGIYIILIFGGQYYMRNRPKFELRGLLFLWNILLATFSIMGACRTIPEFVHTLTHHDGLYNSICNASSIELDRVSGFWTWMFALSKLPELGDTIFIVLRKQPLIFLHWYHHITVLLYTWYGYAEFAASARWFVVMNYCVHAVMYTYFALRAMRYNPPRQFAMFITLLQLLQMVCGTAVNIWANQWLHNHVECHIIPLTAKLGLALYFSYLLLFARLFYKSYLSSERRPVEKDMVKSKVF